MVKPQRRVNPYKNNPGITNLRYNEAICAKHGMTLLGCYDRLEENGQATKEDSSVLNAYGITPLWPDIQDDQLIRLYLQWRKSSPGDEDPEKDSFNSRRDTYEDFYNTEGGGDELEKLLEQRLKKDLGFKDV